MTANQRFWVYLGISLALLGAVPTGSGRALDLFMLLLSASFMAACMMVLVRPVLERIFPAIRE